MFALLTKSHIFDSRCFHCGEEITTVEEFSIEHKNPWLDVSPDLFWDLNNIAFSHLKCNCSNARYNTPDRLANYKKLAEHNRKIGPEGTSWCSGCREFHPCVEFSKNSTKWNGLQKYCRKSRK